MKRKQKIIRNILAVAALLLLTWAVQGFPALTTKQAVEWRVREYGIEERAEILYLSDWDETNRRDVIFRVGEMLGVTNVRKNAWHRTAGEIRIREAQSLTILYQTGRVDPTAILLWCGVDGAVEAECVVNIHGMLNHEIYDETYEMRAAAEGRVFRFPIVPKGTRFPNDHDELVMLWDFQNAADGQVDLDSRHTVTVAVKEESGNVLETYEEILERK